jgi:putative SOS response-associated peptidase YedK
MINARSETVATKPTFRDSFKYRRCLVAADGWYEWKITPAGKVPTYIQRVTADGEIAPFFFAGLWASWRDKSLPDAEPLETFAILTRAASPELSAVCDRMPVVLPQDSYRSWLDRSLVSSNDVGEIVNAAVTAGFHYYPVSPRVNVARNNHAECITVAG